MKLTKKAGGWLETEPEVLVRVGGGFGLGLEPSGPDASGPGAERP